MADVYLNLVNSGVTAKLAKSLGLPRPAVLRRYREGAPLVPGPVLVLGQGESADKLAAELLSWDQDVRRHARLKEKIGAIIPVLDDVRHPEDLAAPLLELGQSLRQLAPGGRVISFSRAASSAVRAEPAGVQTAGAQTAGTRTANAMAVDAAVAAARQGIDGAMRSIGRELRGGATANGILLQDGIEVDSTSALAALRFLLSGKSAFVNGQFLTISSADGALPESWDEPLKGKVAVVTGAARGIGAEIAAVLRRDGAGVVVVDVPAAGEQLAAVANRIGGTALQLDITRPEAAAEILRHVRERFGQLDIVVHNAGITRDRLLANMDADRWESVLAVNIASQLRINAELLDSEVFSNSGRILSLSSTSGIAGNRGQTNYAASKGGVIGMVRATAAGLKGTGRTINAVAPGFIETEMTARIPLLTREVARRLSSLQQGGLPVDVAETIAFLSTDAAQGINGEVLRVCGQNLVGA